MKGLILALRVPAGLSILHNVFGCWLGPFEMSLRPWWEKSRRCLLRRLGPYQIERNKAMGSLLKMVLFLTNEIRHRKKSATKRPETASGRKNQNQLLHPPVGFNAISGPPAEENRQIG